MNGLIDGRFGGWVGWLKGWRVVKLVDGCGLVDEMMDGGLVDGWWMAGWMVGWWMNAKWVGG